MKPAPRLWLLRHAPVLAPPGWCYGRLDLPVHAQANASAAQQMAQHLRDGGLTLAQLSLHCSPRQRCRVLAQALREAASDGAAPGAAPMPLSIDDDLAEMDFGQWEGQPWTAIGAQAMQHWMDDFAHHRPGGGESVAAFMQRVERAWQRWRHSGRDALWVTHAGVIRAAQLLHQGLGLPRTASQWPAAAPAPGGWMVLPPA